MRQINSEFEQAKYLFMAGLDALNEGNLYADELAFLQSLELVPNRPSTLSNLASVQIKLGKYESALTYADKSVNLDLENTEGWLNCGLASSHLGEVIDAINFFIIGLNSNTGEPETYFNIAEILARGKPVQLCP